MSFWNLENLPENGEFETGGGKLEPIPENTQCLASIDEAKWDSRDGAEYISLRWSVLMPAEYKNRKIYHKLWVKDFDPNANNKPQKKEKALRMLAAIDYNAGGKLKAAGVEPTDESLGACLINKPMIIKLMVVRDDVTKEPKSNWVCAVSPKKGAAPTPVAKPVATTEDAPF